MSDQAELILRLEWADVPHAVRSKIELLLRDFVAVSVAGRPTPTACIAADYATAVHPGDAATALLDGRKLAAPGAAWANGVLANALDFDDGHRLVKGHPGANVIPAALAVAEASGASTEQLLAAIAVGYGWRSGREYIFTRGVSNTTLPAPGVLSEPPLRPRGYSAATRPRRSTRSGSRSTTLRSP